MNTRKIAVALAALALGTTALVAQAAPAKMAHTQHVVAAKTNSRATVARVNLNTASVKRLETLPGVGPRLAAEIVKHRRYASGKQLEARVKGIGPSVWARLEKRVTF